MGALVREGYSRLDVLLEEHGEELFLQGICGRVAEGESPDVVSRSMGLPWLVVLDLHLINSVVRMKLSM